jgi:uncharacterized membrane protein
MQPFLAVPIIAALLHRAYSRKSLTPLGLVVAGLTAIAHALNPWSLPLILLLVFYVGGTKATKVHFPRFPLSIPVVLSSSTHRTSRQK